MVSGSISFPSRGAFHLSLTVLVHYRSLGYLALGRGRPSFPAGSSCPLVLRIQITVLRFSVTGLSPTLAGLSRRAHLNVSFVTVWGCYRAPTLSYNTAYTTPVGLSVSRFGLFPVRSPLLRELFLFLELLRCFSSLGCPR